MLGAGGPRTNALLLLDFAQLLHDSGVLLFKPVPLNLDLGHLACAGICHLVL